MDVVSSEGPSDEQISLIEIKLEIRYLRTDVVELRKEFQAVKEHGTVGFEKFQSEITSGIRVLRWIVSIVSGILTLAVSGLFLEVLASREMNAVQQQRLLKLEQDFSEHEQADLKRFMPKEPR